jgi:hypothetical protein
MAIGPYAGRQLEELWMVLQDGRPILRGRPKADAERFAKKLGDGLPRTAAGTTIHAPHIEIAYDRQAMKRRDDLYTEFKEYRHGD